jgi:hypothetical protein
MGWLGAGHGIAQLASPVDVKGCLMKIWALVLLVAWLVMLAVSWILMN